MEKKKIFKTITDILNYIDKEFVVGFLFDYPQKGKHTVAIGRKFFDVTQLISAVDKNGKVKLRTLYSAEKYEFENDKLPLLGLGMVGLFSFIFETTGIQSIKADAIYAEIYEVIGSDQFIKIVGEKDNETFKRWMD